jgi:REP element-mobilizing transposase RayT
MEAKLQYDEEKAAHDQHLYQLEGLQQHQAQRHQEARQAYLAEQAEVLKQYIPEIADPKKGEMLKAGIMDTGIHYGFTPEEMAGVSDARYVRALNDARKYRQLVANKQKSQSKADGVRPVVKAGAKKRPDGQAATRKKAHQRLQKTGSIDDALSLMLKS